MMNFALGPVEMYPHTLEVASHPIPYFRTPEFSEVMLESELLLKEMVGANDTTKTVFLTASGTGAMEATVINCLDTQDRVLIINGGIFGKRFVEICIAHHIPYDEIVLPYGETLTEEHFLPFENKGITALLINIHETSTGQLYDCDMVSRFCKRNNALFIVDAISSFLADTYEMSRYGIDVTILSSQKGLAIAPGMSFVILSERLYRERVCRINASVMYFDFKDHIENQKRGQTPFTPAVGVALELNDMLRHLRDEGLSARLNKVNKIVRDFRSRVKQIGYEYPVYPLSNACTPLIFEKTGAVFVYETLKKEYEIILTPCGGDLKDRMVRVGHIGNHTIEENDILLRALEEVMCRMQKETK